MSAALRLRAYTAADEEACIALWLKTWQATYADIDFTARLGWWRQRWRDELVPTASIVIAEEHGALVGFVTVDPQSGYLDQLAVKPERWRAGVGLALIDEAKRIAPRGLNLDVNIDNARAIAFYRRCGFVVTGSGANPISGKPVHHMSWRP